MPNRPDPRLSFAGQPPLPAEAAADDATVRLDGPSPPDADATFRLDGPAAPDPDATVQMDGMDDTDGVNSMTADESTQATALDPDSWSTSSAGFASTPSATPSATPSSPSTPPPASSGAFPSGPPSASPTSLSKDPEPAADPHTPGLRRFGPGVPVDPNASGGTPHTAAVWHGTVPPGEPVPVPDGPRRRGRALRGWLLPVLVLLAVLAYLGWERLPTPVKIEGVSVRNGTEVQGCHSTAKVIGTVRTSGGPGSLHYRWRRSDGTVSDELTQRVTKGHHSTDVVLLWTFDGPGSYTAIATLDVLGAQPRSSSVTFLYRCAG